MTYTQDFTDILNTLVTGMNFSVTIGSVTVNADGSITLRCDNIYYSQIGFDIYIGANIYRIVDFNQATETITVTGSGTITPGDVFRMYGVKFFHGTPIATAQELKDLDNTAVDNAQNKIPMIWLWENFTEEVVDDMTAMTGGREIECELYALTGADEDAWKTSDAYTYGIKPMRRLIELLIAEIKSDTATFNADELPYKTENYSKFGVFIRTKGATTRLFADKLCGLETKLRLKLWPKEYCPSDFEVDPVTGSSSFDSSFDSSFS